MPGRAIRLWGWVVIAVLGAGAMGVALGTHLARGGNDTAVLATQFDGAVVQAWRQSAPHPALGLMLPRDVALVEPDQWAEAVSAADIIAVAVASDGLESVLSAAARHARANAVWVLATKGWQRETLQTPSEVACTILGNARPVVTVAGPGIA